MLPRKNTVISPPPLRLPPNAIPPEQGMPHHRAQPRGGMGGTGTVPSVIVPVFCIVHILAKGIHQSRDFLKYTIIIIL